MSDSEILKARTQEVIDVFARTMSRLLDMFEDIDDDGLENNDAELCLRVLAGLLTVATVLYQPSGDI